MTIWNALDSVLMSVSGGGLIATSTSTFGGIRSDESRSSGKLVFEFTIDNATPATGGAAGFGEAASSFYADGGPTDPIAYGVKNQGGSSWWMQRNNELEQVENTGPFYDDVFTVRYYMDFDAGVFYTEISGRVIFGGDPSTDTGGYPIIGTGPWYIQVGVIYSGAVITLNTTPTGLPTGWSAWDAGSSVNDLTAANLTNTSPALGPALLNATFVNLSASSLTNSSPSLGAPLTAKGAPFWRFIGVSDAVQVTATGHTLVTTGISEALLPGDLMIAAIASRIASTTAMTLPSGGEWGLVEDELTNNVVAAGTTSVASGTMAYCIRGASNPNLAFTHPTAPSVALGRIGVWRPVNGAVFKDTQVSGTTATNTTAINLSGLTTALNEELLVRMVANARNALTSAFDAATDPTTSSGTNSVQTADPIAGTWQERQDSSTATGADVGLAIADAVRATAGATGNLTATAATAGGHAQITGAFFFRATPVAASLANTAPALGAPSLTQNTSSSDSLTAAGLTNTASVLGPATIKQVHALGAAALANTAPVLGPATIGQTHALTGAALTNTAPVLGPATIGVVGTMAAASLTNTSPVLGPATIGQKHALTGAALTNTAPALGPPKITYNFTAASLTNSAPILGASVTLGQKHVLGAAALTNTAPVLGPASLAGQGALLPSALSNSSPVLGPATIGQKHALTGAALTNTAPVLGPAQGGYNIAPASLTNTAPVLGPATIGQKHVLGAAALSNTAPVLGPATIGVIGTMAAASLTNTAPALGAPALGQAHALTGATLTNTAPVLGPAALTGSGALLPGALSNTSPDLGLVTIGQRHVLGAAALTNTAPTLGPAQAGKVLPVASLTNSTPVLGPATIKQGHALSGSLTNVSPTLGTPPLGQKHVLTAAPLTNTAPDLPGLFLGVVGVMAVVPLTNTAPVLGPATVGQIHVLGAAPLVNSAPALGTPAFVQRVSLSPAALTNTAPAIGAPALGQRHVLTGSSHVNTAPAIGAPQLIPGGVMAAFNLANTSPLIGSPDFRERYTLVAGALTNSNPILGPVQLPARLTATNFVNGAPVIPAGRLNPRYWTKPTSLQGRLNGPNQLSGQIGRVTELEGGW